MKYGKLEFNPVIDKPELVAEPLYEAAALLGIADKIHVAEINPELADTAAFCEEYGIGMDVSANCVIVKGKRADVITYAAVVVLATDRADVNKTIKKHLNTRKISFAPMNEATELTRMEYGGIAPIGVPVGWPILVDTKIASLDTIIIGSGVRSSKILMSGSVLTMVAGVELMELSTP